jgi:hypothetical protein
MLKALSALLLVGGVTLGIAGAAAANNPPGTGQPGQSCQNYSATTRPGHSGSSQGAPFNEPGINSLNGGTGGANYSENSQYDVACFQWAAHHAS